MKVYAIETKIKDSRERHYLTRSATGLPYLFASEDDALAFLEEAGLREEQREAFNITIAEAEIFEVDDLIKKEKAE